MATGDFHATHEGCAALQFVKHCFWPGFCSGLPPTLKDYRGDDLPVSADTSLAFFIQGFVWSVLEHTWTFCPKMSWAMLEAGC